MLRVGLSGGIGSGKSTVAGRLVEHGAVVLDADAVAREVVEPGTPGLEQVVAAFGAEVLGEGGALDRQALAAKVFSDDDARATLNGIVHPLIGRRTAELMAEAPADAVVVHDVPLLVENHLAPSYHLVLMVDAAEDVRVRRLAESRGIAESDARSRIAAQASTAQRREVADVWLDNGGGPDEVLSIVDSLWTDRLVPYESNLRLGRPTDRAGARLVPADPQWPTIARRLAARISAACGDLVSRVDHVGATAVPELPALDVIDLQVAVGSDVDIERVGAALDGAGFVREAATEERRHGSCDPGRRAVVRVRRTGSAPWRSALLLRDWLRAEPTAHAEYRALKQRHGERPRRDEYTKDKGAWLLDATRRAEEWARGTGWLPPV